MHPLIYNFACHVGSTTFADGDYELISDQVVEVPEDPENAVENLTEAPNQSSENFDTSAPNATQEGKPRCITQYFKLLHYAILYLYIISCIKSRR
jgi:hypothetical protein